MANLGEYLGAGSGTTKLLLHLNGNSTDSSGNGNNGTLVGGATYATGKFGQCITLDGTGDYITTGAFGISGGTARTYSVWINTDNASTIKTIIGQNGTGITAGTNCILHCNAVAAGDIYWGFSNTDFYTAGSQITAGSWYHIVAVYEGGTLSTSTVHIYVNGVSQSLSKAGKETITANTTDQNNRIGSDSLGSRDFDGEIDEVIIENRAWSASEVKKYYTYAKGRFGI